MLKLPNFLYNRYMEEARLSAPDTGRLYHPGDIPGSHLLEYELTAGSKCGRKDYVNEKIPMTAMGIEPKTIWFVAHCFNRLFAARRKSKSYTIVNLLLPCTGWEIS